MEKTIQNSSFRGVKRRRNPIVGCNCHGDSFASESPLELFLGMAALKFTLMNEE